MSTYSFYEFQALDRPLTDKELEALQPLSSRAHMGPRGFAIEYNYSNFRGDPDALIATYFDAFCYMANWGSRRLAFRFPKHVLDLSGIQAYTNEYTDERTFTLRTEGDYAIVEYRLEPEDSWDTWLEGEGWLHALTPLRDDIRRGDYRPLYLGWLHCVQSGWMHEEATEPPLPPGLDELTAAQEVLLDFLTIDHDLVAVAAQGKPSPELAPLTEAELTAWITSGPSPMAKDELLIKLLTDTSGNTAYALQRDIRGQCRRGAPAPKPRTALALLQAAQDHAKARRQHEARVRREKERREAELRAAAWAQYVDSLTGKEDETWKKMVQTIEQHGAKAYDEVGTMLRGLRDLAIRHDDVTSFTVRAQRLRKQYKTRPALMRRFDSLGL